MISNSLASSLFDFPCPSSPTFLLSLHTPDDHPSHDMPKECQLSFPNWVTSTHELTSFKLYSQHLCPCTLTVIQRWGWTIYMDYFPSFLVRQQRRELIISYDAMTKYKPTLSGCKWLQNTTAVLFWCVNLGSKYVITSDNWLSLSFCRKFETICSLCFHWGYQFPAC